jgi:hypothetical protein
MSRADEYWSEIAKIDYLLDELARAVERHEIPHSTYDALAPRYLTRRASLAAYIERQAEADKAAEVPARVAYPAPPPTVAEEPEFEWTQAVPPGSAEQEPEGAPEAGPAPFATPAPTPTPYPAAPVREPVPQRAAISPGTWLTYAGALLVVIATAIFAIYAYQTGSLYVKLGVLATVTALFYIGGGFVRTRMDLPVVGIPLIAVGSAMLLFDGWLVIQALGLEGWWPWAYLLLLCSLVYSATELRIQGGWFGGVGAVAQIGWWWLLGQALGLEWWWVTAGVAVVAALWALASERVPAEGPFAAFGTILKWGSVAVAALTTLVAFGFTGAVWAARGFPVVMAAVVVAVSGGVVLRRILPDAPGVSAVTHLPVLVTAVSLWVYRAVWPTFTDFFETPPPATTNAPGWDLLALLAVLAVSYGAYALWQGGAAYAAANGIAAGMFVIGLGTQLHWTNEWRLGVVAAWAAATAVAGLTLRRRTQGAESRQAAHRAGITWEAVGLASLLLASLAIPAVETSLPLAMSRVTGVHVILAAAILGLWLLVAASRRGAAEGWVVFLGSFYVAAALIAWALPGWHSARYATILLLVAVAWSHLREPAERYLKLDARLLEIACLALYVAIPVGGLFASGQFFRVASYSVVLLFAVTALAWTAEALRFGHPWEFAPAGGAATVAAAVAGTRYDAASLGAVTGALAAVACTGAGALWGRRPAASWGAWLGAGAVAAGVLSLPVLGVSELLSGGLRFGPTDPGGRVALALFLLAAAWAFLTIAAHLPELAGVAALTGVLGLLQTLSWQDPQPWVTYIVLPLVGVALLAPRASLPHDAGSHRLRMARSLAAVGLVTLGIFTALGVASAEVTMTTRWVDIGQMGEAFGLALLGVCAVAWSSMEEFEPGTYVGWGIALLGVLVQMNAWEIDQSEYYLIAIAVYCASMGWLWASRSDDRSHPMISDIGAVAFGVGMPFLLSLPPDVDASLEHGMWTLGLAAIAIAIGVVWRSRVYFFGGIAFLTLEALWLSRGVLSALPSWFWIGAAGLVLIAAGLAFARREAIGAATRQMADTFEGWR